MACECIPPTPVPDPYCGDGFEDADEDCDDGNQIDTDGCRNDCTIPGCGDQIVDL